MARGATAGARTRRAAEFLTGMTNRCAAPRIASTLWTTRLSLGLRSPGAV